MKTVMNFLTVTILSLLILTSCTKKDNPTPTPIVPPIITLDQLSGTWNTQTYQYDGVTYDCTSAAAQLGSDGGVFLNFTFHINVGNTGVNEYDETDVCTTAHFEGAIFTYDNTKNIITFDSNDQYGVTNYNSATNTLTITIPQYPKNVWILKKQ